MVDAVAALARGVPLRFARQQPVPERPRAALERTDVVDAADALRVRHLRLPAPRRHGHFLEEDAVVQPLRRAAFFEAVAIADPPAELFERFVARHPQMRGEAVDLDVADPDVPGRTRAAVPALAARELQPIAIPRLGVADAFEDV